MDFFGALEGLGTTLTSLSTLVSGLSGSLANIKSAIDNINALTANANTAVGQIEHFVSHVDKLTSQLEVYLGFLRDSTIKMEAQIELLLAGSIIILIAFAAVYLISSVACVYFCKKLAKSKGIKFGFGLGIVSFFVGLVVMLYLIGVPVNESKEIQNLQQPAELDNAESII